MEEVGEPVLKVPMEEAAGGKQMTGHLWRFLLELSQPPDRYQ